MRASLSGTAIILAMLNFRASGRGVDNPDVMKAKLMIQAGVLMDREKERHDLSSEVASRLALAGRGDVVRYLAHSKGRTTVEVTVLPEITIGGVAQRQTKGKFSTSPPGNLFGEGSLFARTLAKILADREAAGAKDDHD